MATTGELIRMINYVDDIVATLHKMSASISLMDAEERTRLAERMKEARTSFDGLVGRLEKGGQ
jgi:hypothetical protein